MGPLLQVPRAEGAGCAEKPSVLQKGLTSHASTAGSEESCMVIGYLNIFTCKAFMRS